MTAATTRRPGDRITITEVRNFFIVGCPCGWQRQTFTTELARQFGTDHATRCPQATTTQEEDRSGADAELPWECYGCGHRIASLSEGWNTRCPECGSYELHLSDEARRRW